MRGELMWIRWSACNSICSWTSSLLSNKAQHNKEEIACLSCTLANLAFSELSAEHNLLQEQWICNHVNGDLACCSPNSSGTFRRITAVAGGSRRPLLSSCFELNKVALLSAKCQASIQLQHTQNRCHLMTMILRGNVRRSKKEEKVSRTEFPAFKGLTKAYQPHRHHKGYHLMLEPGPQARGAIRTQQNSWCGIWLQVANKGGWECTQHLSECA
eukprot:1158780-Pelagomonas_calceolata.AAC.5